MQQFQILVDEAALDDLDNRLRATRWLPAGSAANPRQGTTTDFVEKLCRYWIGIFDWRALEARINRQPNYLVEIDGLPLHAIHRRSTRSDAIPLILIHGWPTSFLEFLDVCDALADPKDDAPAFHIVVPSLPGHGFSATRPGTSPRKIAGLFTRLMEELGYERFMIQGGNWGSSIGTEMAREHPERIIGLHLNSVNGSPPRGQVPELSVPDKVIAASYSTLLAAPHFNLYAQTPLTIAHALNDSPAGMAAWIGERLHGWADTDLPANPGLQPEWIVATCALYWLTGTAGTSAMLYREAILDPAPERYVTVPTAIAHFARELVMIPRPWAEHHYNVVRWTDMGTGGHYPAVEVPELFLNDLRGFASALSQSHEAG